MIDGFFYCRKEITHTQVLLKFHYLKSENIFIEVGIYDSKIFWKEALEIGMNKCLSCCVDYLDEVSKQATDELLKIKRIRLSFLNACLY